MNEAERQAIRERHTARITDYTPFCYTCEVKMPCDTIRVLDELERWVKE